MQGKGKAQGKAWAKLGWSAACNLRFYSLAYSTVLHSFGGMWDGAAGAVTRALRGKVAFACLPYPSEIFFLGWGEERGKPHTVFAPASV